MGLRVVVTTAAVLWAAAIGKHDQCGMEVSELFPHMAQHVDDIALVRSMYGISPAHGPALFQMNTGSILAGHPSVGSWVSYGLGSENENLPGFIVFTDHRGGPINGPPKLEQRISAGRLSGHPIARRIDPDRRPKTATRAKSG